MKEIIFIIGGCRSGKSRHAIELAKAFSDKNRIFIATCVPSDDEMKARVLRHKQEREQYWTTVEVPLRLTEAITENSRKGNLILVDCLTLWISNLLLEADDLKQIEVQSQKLADSLAKAQCPVILVSNEVGTGIVPENRLARLFRDAAGFVNQRMAAAADRVIWMVAGLPVNIK